MLRQNGWGSIEIEEPQNGNGNQIHAQRAHSFPPASAGSDSFNGIN
jgi:hypothetical protein